MEHQTGMNNAGSGRREQSQVEGAGRKGLEAQSHQGLTADALGLTRREALRVLSAVGTGLGMAMASGIGARAFAAPRGGEAKPAPAPVVGAGVAKQRWLLLGGTAFTGPQLVRLLVDAGYEVAIFNRGKTEQRIGGIPDSVERLVGDRDPKVGEGLAAIEKAVKAGRSWDFCVDLSGQYPRHVAASAELLKGHVGHYAYISSISAYAEPFPKVLDEKVPLAKLADPKTEDMAGGANYGGLKAACEDAVRTVYGDAGLVVRPGLIVGPGDQTDRFTYWPVRISRAKAGEKVLCPGVPLDPCQFIDVRDLAAWLIVAANNKLGGAFNAVGQPGMTIGKLIGACHAATGKKAELVWADRKFLERERISPWGDMPVWVPPPEKNADGTSEGYFGDVSFAKAAAAGLRFRSVEDTVKDTLAWWPTEVARRERVGKELVEKAEKEGKPAPKLAPSDQLRAGITADREAEALAKFALAVTPKK